MDQAWWSPGLIHPDGRAAFALCFTGGIFVDRAGRRIRQRVGPLRQVGSQILAMREGTVGTPYWMVYDGRGGEQTPVMATNVSFSPTSAYRSAGLWRQADTLADLADEIDVPADNLSDTVRRFNLLAEQGVDEDFGRGGEQFDRAFTNGASPLVPTTHRPTARRLWVSDLEPRALRTDSMDVCWTPTTARLPVCTPRVTPWPPCPERPTRAAGTPSALVGVQPPGGTAHGRCEFVQLPES